MKVNRGVPSPALTCREIKASAAVCFLLPVKKAHTTPPSSQKSLCSRSAIPLLFSRAPRARHLVDTSRLRRGQGIDLQNVTSLQLRKPAGTLCNTLMRSHSLSNALCCEHCRLPAVHEHEWLPGPSMALSQSLDRPFKTERPQSEGVRRPWHSRAAEVQAQRCPVVSESVARAKRESLALPSIVQLRFHQPPRCVYGVDTLHIRKRVRMSAPILARSE